MLKVLQLDIAGLINILTNTINVVAVFKIGSIPY